MGNRTVINPSLQGKSSAATVVNMDVVEEYNRQNNIEDESYLQIREGTVICERFTVREQLEVASGEADLYLCTDGRGRYVAKVYKRRVAIKQEVVQALMKIDSPYVAKLYETGTVNGFPVEILPYYENGSLQGKQFSEAELIQTIIPNINEGLHAIHQAGVIHKDLKPSNIMLNNDGKTVSIIDFGISSVMNDDNTIIVTKTGMTPDYSAPETFKHLYLKESDYYSFGITLFELFCGYTPYANMQPQEIEQYVATQKLHYPDNMSPLFQDFISALTYGDISNRNNRSNPNRRWTYTEVRKWLDGEPQIIPGEGIGNAGKSTMPAFKFRNTEYHSIPELVKALAQNWEEGKKQLFRGMLGNYFRTWNQELSRKCQAAEDEAARENGKDDIIFWKLLYQIEPRLQGFYWRGQTYESLAALGRDMLERLWHDDASQYAFYQSILSEKLLTKYVQMAQPKNEKMQKTVAAIEDSYTLEKNNGTDMKRTYYYMAYSLSGQKLLYLDNETIRTTGELATHMKRVLEESYEKFEALCHQLVDYDGKLDFQLETWLMAIGKQDELEKWRASMSEGWGTET